ncbi:unannotated protein [freshwater metagenome]|uniref:Unannotated protein n=1 Tax=freshwater metagenome TaxID=449393 RepID=A0A6J6EZW3_9ZZZZ
MFTSPCVTRAAAKNGPAFDKSGSINQSFEMIFPGKTFQELLFVETIFTPTCFSMSIVISM